MPLDERLAALVLRAEPVAATAALLFDGVFLQLNELKGCWDLTVYLHVPESVTIDRVVTRDVASMGSLPEVVARYARRYLPGQGLYRREDTPMENADIVVDNTDVMAPRVLRWSVPQL